jgi:hypothetical protein
MMTPKQFAAATQTSETILNTFADELGIEATWTQAWAEWHSGSFILKIVYPPGTKKAELKWLLSARRSLAKETRSRWLFIIYRHPIFTDGEIMNRYAEKISLHGGGIEIDLDDEGEGL